MRHPLLCPIVLYDKTLSSRNHRRGNSLLELEPIVFRHSEAKIPSVTPLKDTPTSIAENPMHSGQKVPSVPGPLKIENARASISFPSSTARGPRHKVAQRCFYNTHVQEPTCFYFPFLLPHVLIKRRPWNPQRFTNIPHR